MGYYNRKSGEILFGPLNPPKEDFDCALLGRR